MKGVWTAFPDFHLELLNCGEIEPELVAIHWSLQGTNTGERMEGPPTGRSVSIKGASIIRLQASDAKLPRRAHKAPPWPYTSR